MALLPPGPGSDVRELLSRIRPNAEWGWKGGNDRQTNNVTWRDSGQTEPTEAEYLTEQAVVAAERSARQAENQARGARLSSTIGKHITATTAAEREALLEQLLFRVGATNKEDGTIKPRNQWDPVDDQ